MFWASAEKICQYKYMPSRHGLDMFADQNDVDNFVENYTNAKSAIVVSVTTNDYDW